MKKALRILAIAAILPLMASVAISCKKKPNPNDDPDGPMPVLEETKYDEYVTAGIVSEYETESVRVLVSYDFGGDGTATLGFIDKEVTKALTKAEVTGEVYYEVYPYTVKDGAGNATDYVVEGFGTLSIEVVENTATGESTAVVTIKEEGSTEVDTVTATIPEKVEETTFSKNICRDWKVKELSVDGTGGDLKQRVGRRFTGCDLNEMMAYLKEKGINLNSDKLNYQMNVTLVRISEYGDPQSGSSRSASARQTSRQCRRRPRPGFCSSGSRCIRQSPRAYGCDASTHGRYRSPRRWTS